MSGKDLGVSVHENVKAAEAFGPAAQAAAMALDRQLKGIGGTLHITNRKDVEKVAMMAWDLSGQTKLPVVVVIRNS